MVEGKKNPTPKRRSGGKKTPEPDILHGMRNNELEEVRKALVKDPSSINKQEPDSLMTPLHWACANRNLKGVELLFRKAEGQIHLWAEDKWGRLPMDLAISTGNQSLIDLLHKKMFAEDYEHDFDPLDPPDGIEVVISSKFDEK